MAVDPAREDVDGFDAPGNLVMSVGLHLASLDVSSFTAQIENNERHVWWSEGDVLCLVDAGVSLSLRLWVAHIHFLHLTTRFSSLTWLQSLMLCLSVLETDFASFYADIWTGHFLISNT